MFGKSLRQWWTTTSRTALVKGRRHGRYLPRFELLEDRLAPAFYVVDFKQSSPMAQSFLCVPGERRIAGTRSGRS
jgi:hypothetical protein